MNQDLQLSSYNYQLPQTLIAQTPAVPRDSSQLLIVDSPFSCTHGIFRNLPDWLRAGDLLVLNDTRVIPARLYGRKATGSKVEILLLEERANNSWLALVKPGKRFTMGSKIIFDRAIAPDSKDDFCLQAAVVGRDEATGGRILQFELPPDRTLWQYLEDYGTLPLPPYITNSDAADDRYQTVYGDRLGAIAAPTAGLHFTPELYDQRDGQHHVGQEADKVVPAAAEIPRGYAQYQANGGVHQLRDDADQERHAAAMNDANEDVSPLVVGTERVGQARRFLRDHQVGVEDRVVGPQPRGQYGGNRA